METAQTKDPVGLVAALILLSWLGELVHNAIELPNLTPLSPENSLPALISLLLFLGWWKQPRGRKAWGWLLFAWAGLHLVGGGILSVIPFAFLPFYPAQNLTHYSAHVFYSLAQLPLLWVLWKQNKI